MTYGDTGNSDHQVQVAHSPIDHGDSTVTTVDDVPPPQHVEILPSKMTPKGPWAVVCWSCYRSICTTDATEAVVFRVHHDRTCANLGIVCRHVVVKIIWTLYTGQLALRCASDDCATQIAVWLASNAPQL